MKKLTTVALAIVCACACTEAQCKTTVIGDCALCGYGTTIIDNEVPAITPAKPSSGCSFCGDGTSSSGSSTSSGTLNSVNWTKAMNWSTYLVNSDGAYAGTATISTSKISSKGKVNVKIAFKMATGKKGSASKTSFSPDSDGTISASWSSVKNVGNVIVEITPSGEVTGTAGVYEFSSEYDNSDIESDDGTFVHGEHVFSVEVEDYELSNDDYTIIDETVPTETVIFTSNTKKWNCGKTPSIKYKKIKEDGETFYELVGIDDEVKTNYSGLSLKFNSKKGTFSGSFKVYATNEGSSDKKPKLKKYSFSVKGNIIGGAGQGTATCKKLKAVWPVTIE